MSFPRTKTHPMSSVSEARKLQEAMNEMFKSLLDYRKFLPSTLFLRGEVPLQEELAEELLLGGLENRSNRPSSFRVGSPLVQQHPSSFRGSPVKLPSFKVLAFGAVSPATGSLRHGGGSTSLSPRASRVQHFDEPSPEREPRGVAVGTDPELAERSLLEKSERQPHDGANLAFCLKRRKATVVTVNFVGFLRAAQEDVGEAHRASQTFLQIVLSVVDRNEGIVLSLMPDKVVATWNAFRTDPAHETNGGMCAFELSRTLQAADEEFLFSEHQIVISVTSGPVVAGNTGTASERASVVHGDCVELGNELLSLLVAINVRCAVTKPVADRLPPSLWSLPIDIITTEDDTQHEVFELRSGEEPHHIRILRQGFQAFVAQD